MGPFLFAWVDANETTFDSSHIRNDEEVLSFNLSHSEGDFPSLEITIINPSVGLLAPGRKVWAWLSFDTAWAASEEPSEPDVVPLFFGRLVGVPDDIQAEQVSLSFIARPQDFAAQKAAVAAALKVAPYWDGIWYSPETRDDPDNVLESRPELWHIDRVTHEVTSSDIITGEDGTLVIGEDLVYYDSVSVSYGDAPLRRVDVIASVSWDQKASGVVNLDSYLNFGSGYSILTFTGDGLVANWPKSGAGMDGGWSVAQGSAVRIDGIGGAVWGYGLHNNFGAAAGAAGNPFGRSYVASEDFHDVIVPDWAVAMTVLSAQFPAHIFGVPRWRIVGTLHAGYNVSRNKSERISFSLESNVQSILTEPGDEETLLLTFSSSEIASPVANGESPSSASESTPGLPIGDVANRVYFSSARGTQSIEYLIALARSRLLARARCVSVEFEIPFVEAVGFGLSCRKSIVLTDYRLPGGQAAGKITDYTLSVDGESGQMSSTITIGCTIGQGATVMEIGGTPTCIEEGYVEPGYQFYSGQFVMPIAGEVLYESIEGLGANDDGVDFSKMTPERVVLSVEKSGSYLEQKDAMGTTADEPNTVFARLNTIPTTFKFTLRPVTGGPFETVWPIAVSQLMIPKTIDLEAS